MIDLLTCPFCDDPILWSDFRDKGGSILHSDNDCMLALSFPFYFLSYEEAAKTWNRRTSPWISCEEGLPEEISPGRFSDQVMIYVVPIIEGYRPGRETAHYDHELHKWSFEIYLDDDEYKVTHWMPMPKPPEGRKE